MALTDNWVGGWHLNNDALDSSGNGNDGTVYGATFDATTKKLGSHALAVDGIDDYIYVAGGAGSSLNVGGGDFTIQGWLYLTQVGVNQDFIACDLEPQTVRIRINTANKVLWEIRDSGSDIATATSTTALSINTWYHIIGRRVGTNVKLYVNGVLEASTTNASLNNPDTTDHWHIGVGVDGIDTHTRWFKGKIDEVAVWSRAITDGGVSVGQTATGEVAELYNGGTGVEIVAASTIQSNILLLEGSI